LLKFFLKAMLKLALFLSIICIVPGSPLPSSKNDIGNPSNAKAGINCNNCVVLMNGLKVLIDKNSSNADMDSYFNKTCINLQIEEPILCNELMKAFGSEIYFSLKATTLLPYEICEAWVTSGCGYTDSIVNKPWPLTIPGTKPPVQPWPTPAPGKPTLRVLHLTDIHVDRKYSVGSEADCAHGSIETYRFCCRAASGNDSTPVNVPAGKYGTAARCDIPYIMFEETMKWISGKEKIDYIIVTGDFESHDIWANQKDTTKVNLINITNTIYQYFPNTPVFQTTGNHEGVPMDAFAPHSIAEYETRGPQWLYTIFNQTWTKWLPSTVHESLMYRGSYVFYPFPGLKFISLNTIYCSHWNFYSYITATDSDMTLDWLAKELYDSEQKGEKVHLISHIPSGSSYCIKPFSDNYYKLVNRFENTIAAQFFGHTHVDEFYLYFDNQNPSNRPTHTAFVAPSLTTFSQANPAYKIYTIDGNYTGSTFTVIDEETYWANLTEINANDKVEFKLEYNKRQEYGMKDLSPASYYDLAQRMLKDDNLLSKYIQYYHRNDVQLKKCDAKCRKNYICEALTAERGMQNIFCANL
jgi:sphingomyelin phosphodiesterase